MKVWKILMVLVALAVFFFYMGFIMGFEAGFLEGNKPQFESCGFLYREDLGIYVNDIRNLKINWSELVNNLENLEK